MTDDKKRIRTIDCTPTWKAVLPILLAALEDGTLEGKRLARVELTRMAGLADDYVAAVKREAPGL